MVGVCGVIGGDYSITQMAKALVHTGDESRSAYRDEVLEVEGCSHPIRRRQNPCAVPGGVDVDIWIWGNVVGHDTDRLHPPPPKVGAAQFCANLYAEYGCEFIAGLNGDFVGLIYDREARVVRLFTDRLGSWRLYQTMADDGGIVFSTHLQSLDAYPGVSLSFDEEYVVQHLSFEGGPYGVKTPFKGVEIVHPGTITTYEIPSLGVDHQVYHTPTFDSADLSFRSTVESFTDCFEAAVADRTRDRSKQYGILLSGGADARLVLGALPDDLDVTAYHMAGWMSKEARIAERVAYNRGIDFRLLRRDSGYYGEVLERAPAMWNYEQTFYHASAEGFIDEIRSEVDVLLTGHFMDTLFKQNFIPMKCLNLGPIGRFPLPVEYTFSSLDEFITKHDPRLPTFVDSHVDITTVLDENIRRKDDAIVSYGVTFNSLRDFILGRYHYPTTSDSFFRQSLREHLVHHIPAYDTRLLDLWQSIPVKYRLRRNLIGAALNRIDPDLAGIPHAETGIPVKSPRLIHCIGNAPANALRRLSPFDAVPTKRLSNAPWGNHHELIRSESYVEEALSEERELIQSLPFLDWQAVNDCLSRHMAGENHTRELYRLVTFLKAPLTKRIVSLNHEVPSSICDDSSSIQRSITPD